MTLDKTFKHVSIFDFFKIFFLSIMLVTFISLMCSLFFHNQYILDNCTYIFTYFILTLLLLQKFKLSKGNLKFLFKDLKAKINIKEILFIGILQALISISLILLLNSSITLFKIDFLDTIFNSFESNISLKTYVLVFSICTPLLMTLVLVPILFQNIAVKSKHWFHPDVSRINLLWFSIIFSSVLCSLFFCNINVLGLIMFQISNCIIYCKYKNIIISLINQVFYNILLSIFTISISIYEENISFVQNMDILFFAVSIIILFILMYLFINWIIKSKSYVS